MSTSNTTATSSSWQSLAQKALRMRFVKFGLVGASGTVVNMVVLYLAQHYVFHAISSATLRLSVSLPCAIFIATLNNYGWNRAWTWADRQAQDITAAAQPNWLVQFARYCLASWMGILLQYGLTIAFAHAMDYKHDLLANLLAIATASVSNYLANDRWTFRSRKTP